MRCVGPSIDYQSVLTKRRWCKLLHHIWIAIWRRIVWESYLTQAIQGKRCRQYYKLSSLSHFISPLKELSAQVFNLSYSITTNRDLKPENILLEYEELDRFEIKLTDFGFACFFDKNHAMTEVLGSPLYMAPEIIEEKEYDARVDCWSIGVITYILLSGRPPFKGRDK